jgi:hypothetical protein
MLRLEVAHRFLGLLEIGIAARDLLLDEAARLAARPEFTSWMI